MENETIGKVTLDYKHYSGEDSYSDGIVEDEILNIVRSYPKADYGRIIEANKNWPIMYHLSSQRENIISWLPISKDMKVLEIGSGCGAITGALSKMAGKVDCIDLSRKRSMINATRHQHEDNISIKVGNFQEIEPDLDTDYDYALLIGVFEYGKSYIGGKNPYEDFLTIIKKHVKDDGHIVIAIENRYGLKYWAGCREDHLGSFFSSIECYKDGGGVNTFSRKGLEDIMKNVGINDYHFYYPYPDYKFMTTLFSDDRLPSKGELCNNLRNFDRDRMLLFDEKAAWDGLLDEGQFPFFSNSYLLVVGNRPDTDYIRYSNDRSPVYQISTRIKKGSVEKAALYEDGAEHVKAMGDTYKILSAAYEGTDLDILPCKIRDDGKAEFPYVSGKPLAEIMTDRLKDGDEEGFWELFDEYCKRVDAGKKTDITDLDLVFSNILVDGDEWTVIDYEWTAEKKLQTKEIAFRALYCFRMENPGLKLSNYDLMVEKLGLSNKETEAIKAEEAAFQKKVTDNRLSMGELRETIGGAVLTKDMLLSGQDENSIKNKLQIYTDFGRGFNEEDSFFIDNLYDSKGYMEFAVPLESRTLRLRIDPMMDYCMTEIHEIILNSEPVDIKNNKRLQVNGKKINGDNSVTAVFYSDDPGIVIETKDLIRQSGNLLKVKLTTRKIPADMVNALSKELSKKIRL